MKTVEEIRSAPMEIPRSVRADEHRVLTSCRAGRVIPVAYAPLLREDRISKGSIRLSLNMAETVYPLMNSVNVSAYAHFVPFSAFERFEGMDELNRAYQGKAERDGRVVPFVAPIAYKGSAEIWRTMGIHMREGEQVSGALIEAYNTLVNWRRRARSRFLAQRNALDGSLAEAFWKNPGMAHIVPDYDRRLLDGQVPLTWTRPRVPVSGIGIAEDSTGKVTWRQPSGSSRETGGYRPGLGPRFGGSPAAGNYIEIREDLNKRGFPAIFAELGAAGARISLANIELAKKTVAFAKIREQYAGIRDDYLIDLLMEGIRVPDEALRQPILLDYSSTVFGYQERHATNGPDLRKSVTTGECELTLNYRTPAMNTGGILLVTVEIVPEQLYERQDDSYLRVLNASKFPNYVKDYMDPEPISIVNNRYADVNHQAPNGIFGYAPLNHEWKRSITRIGGKYFRPPTDVFKENRQRFWSMEQKNPKLSSSFWLVPKNLPHTVFADRNSDPFEIVCLGRTEIVGNTFFGPALTEDNDDVAEILAEVGDEAWLTADRFQIADGTLKPD